VLVLQNIVWKKAGLPDNSENLYLQANNIEQKEKLLVYNENSSGDFFSYFNVFNWNRWKKYAGISSLSLHLEGAGDLSFSIFADDQKILDKSLPESGVLDIPVPVKYNESLISFRVESQKGGELTAGQWRTREDNPHMHPVKIALVFCTFNRDEYLFANLERLKDSLPENYGVFVVDNGNRIPAEAVTSFGSRFKIFHNNNTGGSGGFTRGIVEALRDCEEWTHVHLMDDDVVIETESLFRTEVFLSLLKEEHRQAFLSGSMLRLDQPWILHENTAMWTGMRILGHNKGMDLRNRDNIRKNEIEPEQTNRFAAWWYCVIPLSEEMKDDLPFPFFIYGDDMEYSLRRAKGVISLNGVCVWHEPFEKKFNAVMKSYFFCRNLMIVNTLRSERYGGWDVFKTVLANFLVQLFVHDYTSVRFVLESFEDYLKGADYVLNCDNEAQYAEKQRTVKSLLPSSENLVEGFYPIELNSKKHKAPNYFIKKRIAAYNYEKTHVDLRRRSFLKVFRYSWYFLKLAAKLIVRFKGLKMSYEEIHLDVTLWDRINTLPGVTER